MSLSVHSVWEEVFRSLPELRYEKSLCGNGYEAIKKNLIPVIHKEPFIVGVSFLFSHISALLCELHRQSCGKGELEAGFSIPAPTAMKEKRGVWGRMR